MVDSFANVDEIVLERLSEGIEKKNVKQKLMTKKKTMKPK